MSPLSDYEIRRHTVMVDGIQTSITVENLIWSRLQSIARARGISMNSLATEISREAPRGFSSALRVAAVRYWGIADGRSEIGQLQVQVHPILTGTATNA